MNRQKLFLRIGVIGLLATLLLFYALEIFRGDLLPEELAQWGRASDENSGLIMFVAKVITSVSVLAYVAALIGLFFCRRWAAVLFLVMKALFSLGILMSPTVEPGITAFVGAWDSILTGVVLALAFLTDALEPDQD